ncbi:MAG TPA: hypothetical protein DIC60_04610 [Lachnospiraceae bacterium]|nr:hypothetical protein [Lachnospiraceae bacterium]
MDIKYRLYPHPVLWDKNDDYIDSSFDCEIELTREIKKFVLQANFNLRNIELEKLIKNGQAEYILHIESPASSYRLIEKSQGNKKIIKLADEHLLGKISICPFIVTKEHVIDFTNSNLNEDYNGVNFNLCKGTILAIGTQQIFKVDKENEDLSQVPSIFTVYKKETIEEMPVEIELNDNKIRIGLNITDYENYFLNVQNKASVINAFLIYPTLIFAFERIKESFDEYTDYRWFKALEKMFKKYSLELDEDLVASKTSIELAQKVMNLPISKALLDVGTTFDNYEEEQ